MKFNEDAINNILKEFSEYEIVTESEEKDSKIEKFKQKLKSIVETICNTVYNFVNKINTWLMNLIAHSKIIRGKITKYTGRLKGSNIYKIGDFKEKVIYYDKLDHDEYKVTDLGNMPNELMKFLENIHINYEETELFINIKDEIYKQIPDLKRIEDATIGVRDIEIKDGDATVNTLYNAFEANLNNLEIISKHCIPTLSKVQSSFKTYERRLIDEANHMASSIETDDEKYKEDKTKNIYHNMFQYMNVLTDLKPVVQKCMKFYFDCAKMTFYNIKVVTKLFKKCIEANHIGEETYDDDFEDFDFEDFED